MGAIFISYRREDSEGHAGRLFEDLVQRFGKGSVFIDVSGIEPGRDFRKVIDAKVGSCGVLLALIGNRWLEAKDANGVPRLQDPADFVRLETASALKRDIPVVPVLVHGARMPTAVQLPPDLVDLAYRNAVELTHARWDSDVQVLADALLPYVGSSAGQALPVVAAPEPQAAAAAPEATRPSRTLLIGGITTAVVVAAGAAAYSLNQWDTQAPSPAPMQTEPARRQEIASLVVQMNADDVAARKAATTRLIRDFSASPVAIGLVVEQLSATNFQALSKEGRVNVLTYLNDSDVSAWRDADRAAAREAIMRIRQRLAAGNATLGPQVLQLLDRLGAKVGMTATA